MKRFGIEDLDLALSPQERSREDCVLIARIADDLGIGNLWITEGSGRDAFVVLAELASCTRYIGLGTGIVNVFSRTPTALAQATASVMELMGTRAFNLGLGTSGKGRIEGLHGVEFHRPVARLREAIHVIDHVFTTGRLPRGGDLFPLSGQSLEVPLERSRLRLFVAGLTDASLKLAGQHADGWLPVWPSLRHGAELIETVAASAHASGRRRPRVAGFLYGAVGESPDLIRCVADSLAWYVAANGTAYRRLFERYGYTDEVAVICDLWDAGDHGGARASVDHVMLADCTLLGDPESFLERASQFRDAGIDRPVLRLPKELGTHASIAMLAALAQASSRR